MPRDEVDERTLMPKWFQHEKQLAHMLPYVSLVDSHTVRTRVNELFQCIRITGINSYTTDDDYLDGIRASFARIVAQLGEEFSYYVHKVSKGISVDVEPIEGDNFASMVDQQWRGKLEHGGLRDKTITLTVIHRPSSKSFMKFMRRPSPERMREETAKRLRRLNEAVGIFMSGLGNLKPSILSAQNGELVGFLGALNTGQELPLYHTSKFGFLASSASNTRATFYGDYFELSEGVAGRRFGKSYSIKDYSEQTNCVMFDQLNLPVDMIVTHSFTPVNTNMTISRIKRQVKQMQAADDAAVSLRENLLLLADDLEAKRASMGDHHMVVTVFAETREELESLGAEIVNAAASEGVTMVSDRFGANTHYFSQHPGNQPKRLRASTVTNRNFADFAAFHRTQLGKEGPKVPWGKVISIFPTPEKSAYRFSYHEAGSPEKEPTSGHTLIMGRPGSGKSVFAAFLMTQAVRANARVFVFDYRQGMEMAVRANEGSYTTIQGGMPTGLNPLWTEIDKRGIAWLSDWFSTLLYREDKPLTPAQTNRIVECVRQNAQATDPGLRDWQNFASLFMSMDDDGDLNQRVLEWAEKGRFGWIFGHSLEDTFSLDGDLVGFDLTGILDSESDKERMAVLSYLFRRIERKIEDRRPTIIIIDEAWKALDNEYFAERLSQWLVTARKQNTVAVMMTQYASQLERTRTGKTIVEAVPTQVLLPNIRANASDYQMLNLYQKELDTLLSTGTHSRLALIRDDQGSVVVDADLSALGNNLTILGGMEAGEKLVGSDYRDRPDFWRLQQ